MAITDSDEADHHSGKAIVDSDEGDHLGGRRSGAG
jgi:hypothetical protein